MTHLTKLYKVEALKKAYYFNSIEEAGSFITNHKSSSSMSICYGVEHKQDDFSYYYLTTPDVEITIDQKTKRTSHPSYTFSHGLLNKNLKKDEDNFFVVMDAIWVHTGSQGPNGIVTHEITEKDPDAKYENSFNYGEGYYEEKILLLTNESAQLYDIDLTKKIFLGDNAKANADLRFHEQLSVFKRKRDDILEEVNVKKAKLVELEGRIKSMEDEYGTVSLGL